MVRKTKAKSEILAAVHETAKDLHEIGFIDKRKMHKYDLLCLEPIPKYDSKKIRKLRLQLHLSQSVLAAVLNTSTSTIQKWEIGEKHPRGPSLKLLHLLERKGLEAVL
ncbi:MAG: helix-turn-helix domain-containing protein [Polynucleobacter victoriensis]|uniref:Putative transcriptional regulator n=1 Tax=Polynucleobacter victoriensis TaxID=2049319 RepID=A0A212T3S0_9BURK|nr:helix-turn-helix domain-containing protein [Polynucleobacter victoriensis]SNC60683.1 putative transcriptional regulator [Polynucleobacter victoriensis]